MAGVDVGIVGVLSLYAITTFLRLQDALEDLNDLELGGHNTFCHSVPSITLLGANACRDDSLLASTASILT